MEYRMLGNTGLRTSILGMGGFHLLEVNLTEAQAIIGRYLDAGGNYIETAAEYGDGDSETKIGTVMTTRRQTCVLATKCHAREQAEAEHFIARSLRNLQTDYVDILFMHHIQTQADLDRIVAPGGALRAAETARKAGQVRFIGISTHGHPEIMLQALERYPFDVIMTNVNYLDSCNFPLIEAQLLPRAQARGIGVVGMKVVADGLLWRSAAQAFRYAWSLPIHVMPAGMNTLAMVEQDLMYAETFAPLTPDEREHLFRTGPELGTYVCRQCQRCLPCPKNIDIVRIFEYEGWYDRQMWDGVVRDPGDYALRQRLRCWFQNECRAQAAYAELPVNATACNACGECEPRCPYHVPIVAKLQLAHSKLTEKQRVP
jgi:uncharacterized protein